MRCELQIVRVAHPIPERRQVGLALVAREHFEVVGGEFLMTFAYTHPLPIDQQNLQAHWARFNWKILRSFRWADMALPDYQDGVWDVAPVGTEAVMMYGTSGYYVTSSVD